MQAAVTDSRPALSTLRRDEVEEWALRHGLAPYRGRQLYHALWAGALSDVADLTAYPRSLRQRLAEEYRTRTLTPVVHLRSNRDGAEKALFALQDGTTVESVLIPGRGSGGRDRETVCVSSQVGCPAGCTFCATGLGGFSRNLTGAEIADQVMYFAHALRGKSRSVTNVVFMGMGEPLLNARAVRDCIERLTEADGFNLGERRITVSTVGIVPQLRMFAEWGGQVNLAVSLHAPNDELRSKLVPYNARFPIADLLDAVRFYLSRTGRRVSFEYVLLREVNDTPHLARELGALLRSFGGLAHVNVIPWNPFREGRFIRSEGPDANRFVHEIRASGVNATIRYSRGLDIDGACGQLREKVGRPVTLETALEG